MKRRTKPTSYLCLYHRPSFICVYLRPSVVSFLFCHLSASRRRIEPRQLALEHFARRAFRQVRYEINRLRAFVIGQMLATKLRDLFGARLVSLFEHDEGRDLFTVERIGYADGRSLRDRFVAVEHFVYLARVDVFAAAYNHV